MPAHYCIRNAFAQALKVSDANIDKKICNDSSSTDNGTGKCVHGTGGSTTKTLGSVMKPGAEDKWPKGDTGKNHDNTVPVATGIMSLPRDEKVVVAGHLAKFEEGGMRTAAGLLLGARSWLMAAA